MPGHKAPPKPVDHRDRGQLDPPAEALLENGTPEETDAYRIAGVTRLMKEKA